MAAIAQTNTGGSVAAGPVNVTRTDLGASDTLTYSSGTRQLLHLYNTTASPVVVTLTGSGATTIAPAGYGGTISVASGKAVTVPADGATLVSLDEVSAFLVGTVTVSGGTGVTATLFTV